MRAPAGRVAGVRLEKRHQRDLYISRLLDTPRTLPESCSTMPTPAHSKLFSVVLSSLMQDRGTNQVELSRRAGLAVSRLNNYLKGNYRTVTPAHAAAIFEASGGTPADNVALVQAYLFDLLPDGCRGLVEIRVPGARETGKWEVPSKGLPRDFAAAFRALYVLCVSNVKVRQRTTEWVEIMRETKGWGPPACALVAEGAVWGRLAWPSCPSVAPGGQISATGMMLDMGVLRLVKSILVNKKHHVL